MRAPLSIYHIWILLVRALSLTDIAILLQNASDVEEIIIKEIVKESMKRYEEKNNNKKAAVKNVSSI